MDGLENLFSAQLKIGICTNTEIIETLLKEKNRTSKEQYRKRMFLTKVK